MRATDRSILQLAPHPPQGNTNHFFDDLPVAIEIDLAGIQPRHVKQIIDLVREPMRLVDDWFPKLLRLAAQL